MLCNKEGKTFFRKYAFGDEGDKLNEQIDWIKEHKEDIPLTDILNDYHEQEEDDEFKFQWDVKVTEPGSVVHHVYIEDKVENEIVNEKHYQRTFSVAQYKEWLVKAGFTDINCFSDFEEYKEECERIIFVCTKGVNA